MPIARPNVSPFDSRIAVAYLPLNCATSHAFACYGEDVDEPFIIVDEAVFDQPWFTEAHLMILLAHETGHIHNNSEDERQADTTGLDLVIRADMLDVLELYLEEFEARYSN